MMVLLSYPVSRRTPLFPETPQARFLRELSAEGRKPVSTTAQFDTHSGTHIDAPSHYCHDGPTVEEALQPYNEFFPALCVDALAEGTVELEKRPLGPLPPDADLAQGPLLRTCSHRLRLGYPQ